MLKTFTFFILLVLLYVSGCGTDEEGVGVIEDTPINFLSVTPPVGISMAPTTIILVTFDGTPMNLSVTPGIIQSHHGETIEITGPFSPGPLHLRIAWADGIKDLQYHISVPCAGEDVACE